MSCHSVAVILTLVQTDQIRINVHKRNNTKKHSTNSTKHSKYKYTYEVLPKERNFTKPTHLHTHITKQVQTTTVQVKTNTVQDVPK